MTEEERLMEEQWDPEEAKNRIGSLKSPVKFLSGIELKVDMIFVPVEENQNDIVPKPKIVDTGKKNKGSLF